MAETIDDAVKILYERVMRMPMKVLEIFNNFFGEDKVDMQGFPTLNKIKSIIMGLNLYQLTSDRNLTPTQRSTYLCDIDEESLSPELKKNILDSIVNVSNSTLELSRDGFILVYFPRVTVTNEYNRSVEVEELFIKVPISIDGSESGTFTMNRSKYTEDQFRGNYMHSHASSINRDDPSTFSSVCLGSGPLIQTQNLLNSSFDKDRWNLFCLELSKYVEVESIVGIPYHRLENIGSDSNMEMNLGRASRVSHIYTTFATTVIKRFLSYYLDNNDLNFSFRNSVYSLGMTYMEYLIRISNAFIDWANHLPAEERTSIKADTRKEFSLEELKRDDVLVECKIVGNNVFYPQSFSSFDANNYIGKHVCVFKGIEKTLQITNGVSANDNHSYILNNRVAATILTNILEVINYNYGRSKEGSDTTTDQAS